MDPSTRRADTTAPAAEQRWIVVDGRRWRATDPAIPDHFRVELVEELMSARRAVGSGRRTGRDRVVVAARARVADAKVALGERGEPWWDPPSAPGQRARVDAAIRTLARHRGPERTICPSDVARTIGGTDWRALMPLVRAAARDLAADGVVQILQRSAVVDPRATWKGPIRIRIADDADDAVAGVATASTGISRGITDSRWRYP